MGKMIEPYETDKEGLPELTFPDEPGIYLAKYELCDDWEVVMIIFGNAPFLRYRLFWLNNGGELTVDYPDGSLYFSRKLF